MCDVLLIHPPSPPTIVNLPLFPLGIGYLASVLEKEGVETKVLDLNVEELNERELVRKICKLNPKVVGISSTSITLPLTLKLARLIKSTLNVPICLGGAHANADPLFIYNFSQLFDYQIVGEGEITFLSLVKELLKGRVVKKRILYGKRIKDLDSLPSPAYHLFPIKRYDKLTFPIIGSRGCPFNCNFCNTYTKEVRFRNVAKIAEEINLLKERYKIKGFEFEDSNFTLSEKFTQQVCENLIKEKVDTLWECQTRCDLVNRNLLKLMKKSGCHTISFGIETFSEDLQRKIGKNLSLSSIIVAIKLSQKLRIRVAANCLFGFPMEEKEDVKKTVYYLLKLMPDFVLISFLVPFPSTRIFLWLVEKQKIKNDIWIRYAKGYNPLPISLSENFNPIWYLFYLAKILAHIPSISTPRPLIFSHLFKFNRPLSLFIYRKNIYSYFRFFLIKYAKVTLYKKLKSSSICL